MSSGLTVNFTVEGGDLAKWGQENALAYARAADAAIRGATAEIKAEWRNQVLAAGLGPRLAKAVQSNVYKDRNDAGFVYSRAPEIMDGNERGALIRARDGYWLAIPTKYAGPRGGKKSHLTPAAWMERTGMKLRMVSLGRGKAILVADGARVSKHGLAKASKSKANRARWKSSALTIFVLVPQVKLPKRLNLYAAAERIMATIPARIEAAAP